MTTPLENFRATVAGEWEPPPVARLVGFRMTAIEPGRATFELGVGPQHASPLGTVHGGILCDVADVAHATSTCLTLRGEAAAGR